MDYKTAAAELGKRDSRKLGNNTYLVRLEGDSFGVRYHDTVVLEFRADGSTVLSSGGWRTYTTKERIHDNLPRGWSLWQMRGVWYLAKWEDSSRPMWRFADGITIGPDGAVSGALPETMVEEQDKLRRAVLAYARAYVQKLAAGDMRAGDAEDYTDVQNPRGLVERSEFTGCLAWEAFNYKPSSVAGREWVMACLRGDTGRWGGGMGGVLVRQVQKAVRGYLLLKLGLS